MNWKFHAPLTSLMDMVTPLRGEKWFLFGLLLVIFISTGFAEEDGKTNTTSKGFPSIYGFFFVSFDFCSKSAWPVKTRTSIGREQNYDILRSVLIFICLQNNRNRK